MKRSLAAFAGWVLVCGASWLTMQFHTATSGAVADVHAAEAPVTFTRQIAPILYKNCVTCHHPGGAGPFSLISYQDVAARGKLIETVTQSRYMPPWLPEPGYGDFAESRRLPDADVATIKKWVEAGMPQGDMAALPKAPVFSSDWQLGPPDLDLEGEFAFTCAGVGLGRVS